MMEESGVVFKEVQRFNQRWLWFAIIAGDIISWAVIFISIILPDLRHGQLSYNSQLAAFCLLLGSGAFFAFFILCNLETKVTQDGLYIKFFPFQLSYVKIPLENVSSVQAVTYSPLRDYGGWGIRIARNGKAYNPTGNRGVRIEYSDGKHIMIGSQKPEELANAIESVCR